MFPHPDSAIQLTVMRYDELLAEAAQMRRAALAVDASRCPSALATARHLVGSGLIRLGAYLQGDAGGSIPVASPLRMSAARTA